MVKDLVFGSNERIGYFSTILMPPLYSIQLSKMNLFAYPTILHCNLL